jgi:pyrroloquinoline quinone (PQQ) biosynthesis protein C
MELLKQVDSSLDTGPAGATSHPFFARFAGPKTREQIVRFAQQWYRAAYNHKVAFPYLVAITSDDHTRQELTVILFDEYGNGNPDEVHAFLLQRFLTKGIGIEVPARNIEEPEIAAFGQTTLQVWSNKEAQAFAFGYHYALERIAQHIHKAFLKGLQDGNYPQGTLRYFEYHSVAEEEHVRITRAGFERYASDPGNHEALLAGVQDGEAALKHMWDGFERVVFH